MERKSNGRFAHHMDGFYAQQKGDVKTIRFCPNCGQAVGNGEYLSQHDGMEWCCEKCGMVFDVVVYDEEYKPNRTEAERMKLKIQGSAWEALMKQFKISDYNDDMMKDEGCTYVSFSFKPETECGDCDHMHVSFGIKDDGRAELIDYSCECFTGK